MILTWVDINTKSLIATQMYKNCPYSNSQEKSAKQSELTVIRKQSEKEYLEKLKLEDEIMKELQTQLTSVKEKEYTLRKTNELRARKTKLVS